MKVLWNIRVSAFPGLMGVDMHPPGRCRTAEMEADLPSPVTEPAEASVDSVTEEGQPGERVAFGLLLLASFFFNSVTVSGI